MWSYTAVLLGTAVGYDATGVLSPISFTVALALGGLIQGWSTHAINEIYDWRSGTDRIDGSRAFSRGSRVRNMALLEERDLWGIFAFASIAVGALTLWVILARAPWLALLVVAGYGLGGFPGVLLSGLGAFAIQTLSLSWVAATALAAHALVCTSMLMVHHYLDVPMDAAATPPKRTTVVGLGLERSKRYAAGMSATAATLYALLGILAHPGFLLGAILTFPAVAIHLRMEPTDLKSATRDELRIIQLGIAAGLLTAVALAPPLWPMVPLAALGYVVHLVVVAPPAELARAWRRTPAGDSDARNA